MAEPMPARAGGYGMVPDWIQLRVTNSGVSGWVSYRPRAESVWGESGVWASASRRGQRHSFSGFVF